VSINSNAFKVSSSTIGEQRAEIISSFADKLIYQTALNVKTSYTNYDDIAELDGLSIRPREYRRCRGTIPDREPVFMFCAKTLRYRKTIQTCKEKNCPVCAKQQQDKRVEKYATALKHSFKGKLCQIRHHRRGVPCPNLHLIAVMLSGYRVKSEDLGENVQALHDLAADFCRKWYAGSIITMEHKYHEETDEYYIHAHALVIGQYQEQENLSSDWGRLVYVSDLRWTPPDKLTGQRRRRSDDEVIGAGVYYPLKYISKGTEIQDKDLHQLKRVRYVRATGDFYRMPKPVYQTRCKCCNRQVGVCTEETVRMNDDLGEGQGWKDATDEQGNVIGKYREPLEIERVLSHWTEWRGKRSKVVKVQPNQRDDWLKDKWIGQFAEIGMSVWLKWIETGRLA
jgi:hypothetical protein